MASASSMKPRDLLVKGVEGVESGGVDDGRVLDHLTVSLDLHVANSARLLVELMQEGGDLRFVEHGDRPIPEVDRARDTSPRRKS